MIEAFIEANKSIILKCIIDEVQGNADFRVKLQSALNIDIDKRG